MNTEFAVLKIAAHCQGQVDFLVRDNAAVIHLRQDVAVQVDHGFCLPSAAGASP